MECVTTAGHVDIYWLRLQPLLGVLAFQKWYFTIGPINSCRYVHILESTLRIQLLRFGEGEALSCQAIDL